MGSFKSGFWASFGLIAVVIFAPMILATRIDSARLPPKPDFPIPGRRFVAEYGGQGANVAHLVYWWGLFGSENRIRRADVLLLGSSHTQFGLSARQLSEDFSRDAGRPIRVFNVGLGCDTPLSFDASLLDHLDIRNRTVIADTFAYSYDPYNYACFSEFSGITDRVEGLSKALAMWSRFDFDWLLDGSVPRIDLRHQRAKIGRYLNETATILDWQYGDAAYLFRPDEGEEFPLPVADDTIADGSAVTGADGQPWRLASGTMPLPKDFQSIMDRRHIQPIFTLVPFVLTPGFNLDRYENVAQLLAGQVGRASMPFVTISAKGLTSFDGGHLTGAARSVATDRLAASVEESGLLSSVLKK
jgi:hypothetical protein